MQMTVKINQPSNELKAEFSWHDSSPSISAFVFHGDVGSLFSYLAIQLKPSHIRVGSDFLHGQLMSISTVIITISSRSSTTITIIVFDTTIKSGAYPRVSIVGCVLAVHYS